MPGGCSGSPAEPVTQSLQTNNTPAKNNVPQSSQAASTASEVRLHPSVTQRLSQHAAQSTGQNQLSGILTPRSRATRTFADAETYPAVRAGPASPGRDHALPAPKGPDPGWCVAPSEARSPERTDGAVRHSPANRSWVPFRMHVPVGHLPTWAQCFADARTNSAQRCTYSYWSALSSSVRSSFQSSSGSS